MSLEDWWRLARGEHALITLVAVVVGGLLATKSFSPQLLLAAIGPALITLASFIINDYFDLVSDREMKRTDRPLVMKKIKFSDALYAAIILFVAGVAATIPFGVNAFLIALVYAAFAFLYSYRLKRMPLIGNLFVASSMAVPFLYGNVAANVPLQYLVIVFALIAFVVGIGREFFLTTRDVAGDKKLGSKTLPMIIGAKTTLLLASVLFFAGVLLSFLPAMRGVGVAYIFLVGICDLLLLKCVVVGMRNPSREGFNKIRKLSLIAMILGVLGFASLAV